MIDDTYRHATDLIDGVMVAQCPDGCQSWELDVETSKHSLDELVPDELLQCTACGRAMDTVAQEQPSEVLQ